MRGADAAAGAAAAAVGAGPSARPLARPFALSRRSAHYVRRAVWTVASAGARHVAAARRAAPHHGARAPARLASAQGGRLTADVTPAVPGNVARPVGAEE